MAAKKSSLEKTKTPGVYRRGKKYVYAYRVRGVQRWKTVDTYDEARRGKLAAEVDVDRGELRDLSRVSFGDYAASGSPTTRAAPPTASAAPPGAPTRRCSRRGSSPTSTVVFAFASPRSSPAT
jgi:hypothetical protein